MLVNSILYCILFIREESIHAKWGTKLSTLFSQDQHLMIYFTRWELSPSRRICIPQQVPLDHRHMRSSYNPSLQLHRKLIPFSNHLTTGCVIKSLNPHSLEYSNPGFVYHLKKSAWELVYPADFWDTREIREI